jgi:3-hydroxyethyl bacteriochlorophyllide a dehydrogenase
MKTHALLFTGPGTMRVGEIHLPDPAADEVLVRTSWSCISPGTESRCLAGKQAGAPPWPFIPGYALAGTVIDAGASAAVEPGSRVFCSGTRAADVATCWGGHTAHALVKAADLHVLPADADLKHASLGKLAAIAWHGVKLGNVSNDDRVAVIGLGILGQLSARLCRMLGAEVFATDRIASRTELAAAAGIRVFDGTAGIADGLKAIEPSGVDVVIDVTGVPSLLGGMADLLKDKPWDDSRPRPSRVIVQGSYPGSVEIPYDPFFMKEASVSFPRDAQPGDVREALELLTSGALRTDDLISLTSDPQHAQNLYQALSDPSSGAVCACIRWHDGK